MKKPTTKNLVTQSLYGWKKRPRDLNLGLPGWLAGRRRGCPDGRGPSCCRRTGCTWTRRPSCRPTRQSRRAERDPTRVWFADWLKIRSAHHTTVWFGTASSPSRTHCSSLNMADLPPPLSSTATINPPMICHGGSSQSHSTEVCAKGISMTTLGKIN
jgi:hypothetical protein